MARSRRPPLPLAQYRQLAERLIQARRSLAVITRQTLSCRVPAPVLDAALRVDRQLSTLCLRLGEALGDHGIYAVDAPAIAPAIRQRGWRPDVEEHRWLGAELRRMRTALLAVASALQVHYPKASPVGRAIHRPEREVDRLRCMLDGLFCRHHPEAFDPRVYYPGPAAPPAAATLVVCKEESDAAAARAIGCQSLCVPWDDRGAEAVVARLCGAHLSGARPRLVVIVADVCEGRPTSGGEPTWPGIEGGLLLAERLMPQVNPLRFCLPPPGVDDLGLWARAGEPAAIRAAMEAAPRVHPAWLNRAWQNVRDNRRLRSQGSWARRAAAVLSGVADAAVRAGLRGAFEDRAAALAADPQLPPDEGERLAFEEMARKAVQP